MGIFVLIEKVTSERSKWKEATVNYLVFSVNRLKELMAISQGISMYRVNDGVYLLLNMAKDKFFRVSVNKFPLLFA